MQPAVTSHIRIMTTTNKIDGEITVDLMEVIIKALPKLTAIHSTNHSILIHGMGGKPRSFYNDLKQNKSIEILWTGWSSNVWWTNLLSFIPGQAGLTKVLDRTQLDKLFFDIGAQSMCGLYFMPNSKVETILSKVKNNGTLGIEDFSEYESDYFLLTVDFDFESKYYFEIIIGSDLDKEIKMVFKLIY